MGMFSGHAIAGSFFIVFALWWTTRIYARYWISKGNGTKFTSVLSFNAPFLCSRLKDFPIEAAVKIVFATVGCGIEIYAAMEGGKFVYIANAHHVAMYFFFGLTGMMDLLVYYKAPIPANTDYVTFVMAFGMEGLLFHFHLNDRPPLDVLIHTLLVYVIALNAMSVILEMRYRNSLLPALGRCYFTLLQGTWFYQIGFILYNPNNNWKPMWDVHERRSLSTAVAVFTWHCGIILIMMMILGAAIKFLYRSNRHDRYEKDTSMHHLIRSDRKGQLVVCLDEEGDSDIEFNKTVLMSTSH